MNVYALPRHAGCLVHIPADRFAGVWRRFNARRDAGTLPRHTRMTCFAGGYVLIEADEPTVRSLCHGT